MSAIQFLNENCWFCQQLSTITRVMFSEDTLPITAYHIFYGTSSQTFLAAAIGCVT